MHGAGYCIEEVGMIEHGLSKDNKWCLRKVIKRIFNPTKCAHHIGGHWTLVLACGHTVKRDGFAHTKERVRADCDQCRKVLG